MWRVIWRVVKMLPMKKPPSHDIVKEFGAKIVEIRKKQGLKRDDLADRCGINPNQLGRLERGEGNPRLATIFRVSAGLGVGLRDLFERRANARSLSAEEVARAEIAKILRRSDIRTHQLAINVVRDVVKWKDRYGAKR